ncbi:MAG: type II secretion system protein [Oliverpabstia sp.]
MKIFRHNKIRKKLNNSSGMTLVEVLCAVLILLLVTGGMTTTVSLAVRQYQRSIRDSESKVLYSTLMTILRNELTYTTEIKIDNNGNVKQFQSQNYAIEGNLSTIMTDESGDNGYGQILLGNSDDVSESMPVVGKGAYSSGLLAKVTKITYDNASFCFTVYLSIGYNGTEYYGGTFQVMNVNKKVAQVLSP